jgi:hypothetical protein
VSAVAGECNQFEMVATTVFGIERLPLIVYGFSNSKADL